MYKVIYKCKFIKVFKFNNIYNKYQDHLRSWWFRLSNNLGKLLGNSLGIRLEKN